MDKNKIHYCPVGLIQRQFGIYVTDLPIAQIAEETGFESHAYFSRLFHARVGTPPIQFRLAHAT